MIDLDHLVEQLYQHTLDTPEVTKEKMRITLSLALQKQCDENLHVIYKYLNQWNKTKATSLQGIEDNDPTSRLVILLFSLITDDIHDVIRDYENTLSK